MDRRNVLLSAFAALTLAFAGLIVSPVGAQAGQLATGVYTYAGEGTVNTHWIETPGTGLIVIDVQRDLAHAREALAAVRATGKPVRAILITHGHPDHYAGIGVFKEAFPQAVVWSSNVTADTIRNDPYGYNALMRKAEPGNFPLRLTAPERTFAGDATLEIDGLTVVARELGKAEANSATVFYVPATGDLYVGDLVLNRLHGLFTESATTEWLAALDRTDVIFPNARIVHPGHGVSGPKAQLFADQRTYIVTARRFAIEALARSGPTPAAEAEVARHITERFPYENPAGLPNLVQISVRGLFAEFATRALTPVK